MATARVDAWCWAVLLFKTRSQAAAACRAGHVRVNQVRCKPAQNLVIGDEVRVWVNHRELIVVVQALLTKRVGAPEARAAYLDKSPPPPSKELLASMPQRDRGAGRPTKRERREIDRLRGFSK